MAQQTQRDPVKAAIVQMRDTAKWLFVILGAIGTLMIAGVQLSDLGNFSPEWLREFLTNNTRFWTSAALFAVTLVLIGVALSSAVKILSSQETSVQDLTDDELTKAILDK